MENNNYEKKNALIDLEIPSSEKETSADNKYQQIQNQTESVENSTAAPTKLKRCLFIELNPGISHFNLFCYYLVQFGYVMAFTFIDACQDYLLESKDYDYKIDHKETGSVNGNLLLFDTLYLVY